MRYSLLAAAFVGLAAQPAQAAIQHYTFKGFIIIAEGKFDQQLLSPVSGTVAYSNEGAREPFLPGIATHFGVRSVTFNFEGGSAAIDAHGFDNNLFTLIADSSLAYGFERDYFDFTANFQNGPVPAAYTYTGIPAEFGPPTEFRFILQDPSGAFLKPTLDLPDSLYLAPGMTGLVSLGFGFPEDTNDFTYLGARLTELIPVDAVPEPATWAMMIAGFGLAGAAVRRSGRPITALR